VNLGKYVRWSIRASNNDEVSHFTGTVHSKLFWNGNRKEVGFQPRCKDVKKRRRNDVLWQIAPDTSRPGRLYRRRWRVEFGGQSVLKTMPSACSRCRASRSAGRQSSSMRYGGANPCRHLYTRTASLKSVRSRTFSQWS